VALTLLASLKDGVDSWSIRVNKSVGESANLTDGQVVEIFNRDRGTSHFYRVRLDARVRKTIAVLDRSAAELLGTQSSDTLEIEPSEERPAREVLLRVEMPGASRQEQIALVEELNRDSGYLLHEYFARGQPVFNHGAKIFWEEKNIALKIMRVDPYPAAVHAQSTNVRVALSTPFNGILMLDTSGSMWYYKIPNTPGILKLSDDPVLRELREQREYWMLNDVVEAIEHESDVPRLYAAIAAVLLYFSEKAERELSERVALIPYNSTAKVARYFAEGKEFEWLQIGHGGLDTQEKYKRMLIQVLFDSLGKDMNKPTNGLDAFEEVVRLIGEMDRVSDNKMPSMVIVLSDGEFNGKKGTKATLEDVREVSGIIVKQVQEKVSTNRNVIVNCVYIGDDSDERGKIAVETLRKIAEMTRGEFIQPKKLTDLAKFYERSAQNLVYDLGTVKEEVFRKAEVDRSKIELAEADAGPDAADAEDPGAERPGPG
jgi:hypothetical protein